MEFIRTLRSNVLGYERDTYLGSSPVSLNPDLLDIDCSTGFAQWGVSQAALEAHKRFDVSKISEYPELTYDDLLKPAILARFQGSGLGKSNLFLGHGSFNLAERLIHKCLKPSCMIGPGPQFNEIPSEFVAAGGKYIPIPFRAPAFEFPLEALLQALTPDVSIIYLDNPNNPLGSAVDLAVIGKLADAAAKNGTVIMVDEAYGDFLDDKESAVMLVSSRENIVVLRSFSKALGLAAARVGYLFIPFGLAKYYRPLDVPFEPSLYSATLACATTEDGAFLDNIRSVVRRTKSKIATTFEECGFNVLPTHPGTSIMTVHRKGWDTYAALASMSIKVEPGSAFVKTNPAWDNSYCRVRVPKENQIEELRSRIRVLVDQKEGQHAHQR